VLAGTGSNCTAETVKKTKFAERAGADAAMLVAPYYNRPPQEGLFRHFAAVAEAVSLPLVLYNVPARTGVTISNDTVVRLRERFPNIVAIKDATGVVDNVTELLSRCDIGVLCGDDVLTWPMMALGGVGVISVISNLCLIC
jgi:4-hydroxy-tetrahydrodipicolinate synthase